MINIIYYILYIYMKLTRIELVLIPYQDIILTDWIIVSVNIIILIIII